MKYVWTKTSIEVRADLWQRMQEEIDKQKGEKPWMSRKILLAEILKERYLKEENDGN